MPTKNSAESRRDQRKQRLAATAKSATPASKTSTRSEIKTAPKEITAAVADPTKITATDAVKIFGPFNQETQNPHWMVIAGGKPLAEIALADQEEPDKMRSVFATADYANGFMSTLRKKPLNELLVAVRARPYIATVKTSEVFTALDRQYQAKAAATFKEKAATYQDELLGMTELVVEAQRKNFLADSPLKAEMVKKLTLAGVKDPVKLVDDVFVTAHGAHMEATLAQATKWMGYKPEALADISSQIKNMPVAEARTASPQDPKKLVPSSEGNVPLSTVGGSSETTEKIASTETSDKEALKKKYGFRARMNAHALGGS